ncbi:MAG: holo-ACP synthase [Candidatus Endonucleobacter bathymodioli]|uniref:Holo-[acyl-carrier-protein] synthase n=1 Tax=Candidatus Endonucleibacter bathymodioli TaxID=539814 RepID=A0AA90NR19_9GAMM|nr:holo-ACP synthase [Candidatus Endonucleobacter bathymodioli]
MIEGVGVDIIKTDKIAAVAERHGDRFARRILMDSEFAVYKKSGKPIAFLAKRFAAKEAAAKALGTGIGKVSFHNLKISNKASGAPVLTFHGYAAELQKERGITRCHLTLSDETDNAVAFVVLESDISTSLKV